MPRHLNYLRAAFVTVFARPSYVAAASGLATVAFVLAVWFPNLGLIGAVFGDPNVPLMSKLDFALSLLGGIGTNFSLLSAGYTVAIAVLFGVNTVMIVYLVKQRHSAAAAGRHVAMGSGALATGMLGIGCAACGSLVGGAAFSFLGAGSALAVLPLNGGEFGIASVALLFVSLLLLSRTIAEPAACAVAPTIDGALSVRPSGRLIDRGPRRKPLLKSK